MGNNLYEEAINAAEQIKEAAESKVKQQLVEAMSPKIKQLIEKSLLGEESIEEMGDAPPVESSSNETDQSEEDDKKEDSSDSDDSKNTEECGVAEEDSASEDSQKNKVNEVEISSESAGIIRRMLTQKNKKVAIQEKLDKIGNGIKSLNKALLIAESSNKLNKFSKKFRLAYKNLLNELKNIESNSIIKTDKTLLKEYLRISKELKNMSTRRRSRKNYLNESLEDLLEMNIFEDEDDEGGEELELNLDDSSEDKSGDEEGGEELELDLDEPAGDDAGGSGDYDDLMSEPLDKILDAALKGMDLGEEGDDDEEMELDVAEEADHHEGVDEVYEIEEMEMEGMEEIEEMEMEGMEEVEEGPGCAEDEVKEMKAESRRGRDDLFLEIDENMLKKEITKMRRLREGEASDMAHHFGGGSLDKEMFVDVDDGDLNVHSGVLGREDVPMPKVEAALRKTMRKNRMLESKIRQYKNAVRGMKSQLSEMNLFNAKLLYANKLMQNRDLSIKQQRHIVESLDEAGTLNEAKLLFESLSKSLSKPARKGRNLSEGANRRTLASASRSTKSAQTLNENVALDRWATLAGIRK
tara:strand:+ start:44 stop:1786 length:1743 start_codon:yes stop_codon:yes gene_type:complete